MRRPHGGKVTRRQAGFGKACASCLAETGLVIAHPTSTGGWTDNLAANTNWRTARTEAWLAFAVLTTERKAA
jgi:hypothetical protein